VVALLCGLELLVASPEVFSGASSKIVMLDLED
jgi:hypothetical protein